MKNKLLVTGLLSIATVTSAASAAELMPNLSLVPAGWTTDRYEPTSFSNVGTFQGRDNVLGIEITSAGGQLSRPGGQQGLFYSTQGRKHLITGGAGDTLSADLWVDSSWQDSANGHVRSDVWGTMIDSADAVSAYPILGFTNYGGAARFRYYDGDVASGWVDLLSTQVLFGAWNTLSIGFTGTEFTFSVNGVQVGTDATIGGSTGFKEVIMQAYNFDHADIAGEVLADYTAHWSNVSTGQNVPDSGMTLGMLGLALAGVAFLRRKMA
jgi:hypothetical protein